VVVDHIVNEVLVHSDRPQVLELVPLIPPAVADPAYIFLSAIPILSSSCSLRSSCLAVGDGIGWWTQCTAGCTRRPGAPLRYGSDFGGLGTAALVFENLGLPYTYVFDSETKPWIRRHFNKNLHVEYLESDARVRVSAGSPKLDLYVAGFPCTCYSPAGTLAGMAVHDWKDELMWVCVRAINDSRPGGFILESVPNFLRACNGALWAAVREELSAAGYSVSTRVFDARAYGLPQRRVRLYIRGTSLVHCRSADALLNIKELDMPAPALLLDPRSRWAGE